MSHAIVPTSQLGNRVPEHGRIRLGVKTGSAMKSIDTFRFTSPDEVAIKQLAERYGGTAKPWSDARANPKDQFEVITKASEIRVFLPPDSVSTFYEQWTAGGCSRRCNGETCEIPGRDGMDLVPCICLQPKPKYPDGLMECKPYTRLNVVLPDVRFGGTWRLETKGWNAAHEMPGMAAMIETLHQGGMAEARLRLDKEKQVQGGKTKNFVVPRLLIPETPVAMLEGGAQVAISAGEQKALPAATPPEPEGLERTAPLSVMPAGQAPEQATDWFDGDDDVVDAEIVDEPAPASGGASTMEPEITDPGLMVHYLSSEPGSRIPCGNMGSTTSDIESVDCPDCQTLHQVTSQLGGEIVDTDELVHYSDEKVGCFTEGPLKSDKPAEVTCLTCIAEIDRANGNVGQPAQRVKRKSQNPALAKLVIECGALAEVIVAASAVEPIPGQDFGDEVRHAIAWYVSKKQIDSAAKLSQEALVEGIDLVEKLKSRLTQAAKLMEAYRGRPM